LHAEIAREILRDVGYDSTTIGRVQALLRKERLKSDPEVQCLEDVACLVFLKYYLTGFAVQHDEEKLIGIIRKTWRKMSRAGQIAALKLSMTPELQKLVSRSIGSQ
jgi:poly-gamma-glutamate capsule biosynthesis protein CapA/YwtB (metallophosphatase superfamily)